MTRIAWRMLWQRPANMVATFLALWFAVVVVTACGVMLESGIRYHGTTARYAAAPVLVATTSVEKTQLDDGDRETESEPLAAPGRLPASVVRSVAAVPGVRSAIGDAAVPAAVGVKPVAVHPWTAAQLAPFTLRSGAAPAAGQAVVDAHLGVPVGRTIDVALPDGSRTFTVSGLTDAGTLLFVNDDDFAALSGDTVQVVGVFPQPGVTPAHLADAIRKVLPTGLAGAYPHVYTGPDRGSAESLAVDNGREFVIAVSSAFGGNTLMIALLVIVGTVGLSVRQRHRDIALLRAIAATPRQIRRMVVVETAVIGLVAIGAGLAPGIAGATWLRDQYVSHGLIADDFHVFVSWLPPLVAAAAALLFALAGAWAASVRSSGIRPSEALAESAVERRGFRPLRTLFGIVALAGGIVLCVLAAHLSADGAAGVSVATVFTLTVAVAMLSPLLIQLAALVTRPVLTALGVTGRLASANTSASAVRLSAVVSSLVLAVALGGSLWFVQTSIEHTAQRQNRDGILADQVVLPGSGGAAGLPASLTPRLRQTPGVTAATGVVHGTMFVGGSDDVDPFTAMGLDPTGVEHTVDLGVTQGRLADLHGDALAVDTLTAEQFHLKVGSPFSGWLGDGTPTKLRVVAVYQRGIGFAAFTVPHDLLLAHSGTGRDDAVFVAARDPKAVAAALPAGATLVGRDGYQVALAANLEQNAWTNQIITLVLLVYTVIAAANTLVMASLARRREFAVLRLSGTTRPQVLRMVRLEQALLLGLTLLVGASIAAATLLPMVKGITGSATPYIPPAGWLAVIGGVVLLGATATLVPVRRVLRMEPVEAIGIRE
jgi:putative ABC transport system permease protein